MWQHAVAFFNSAFYGSLITLFVGSFAYGVYSKRQRDAKKEAARVILLEIEEAEQQLTKVSSEKPFPDLNDEQIRLMQVASWDKFKHHFTHDFDRNETDKISDFYTRCAEYDSAAKTNASMFIQSQNELRVNFQRVLADYAREYNDQLEKAKPEGVQQFEKAYIERRKRFISIYGNTSETHMYTYVPVKPFNDASRALRGLEPSLSLTSVGTKLKAMCEPRRYVFFNI